MAGGAHTAEFIAALEPFLKPGDVINIDTDTMWYDLPRKAGYWALRREQLDIYGMTMRWRDVHTMLYFGNEQLFTMDSFQGGWFDLSVLEHANVSVYRYAKRALSSEDVAIMRKAADELTGTPFIENQQLEKAAALLGYKSTVKPCFFDMARFAKPGAIGARTCYEYLRKELERRESEEAIPRLFSKFRYDPFGRRDRVIDNNSELRGVDVEATSPAHFANSYEYDDEFELVAEFHHGQQIVPEPPPPAPEPEAADAHGHSH